jgi:hypothetical protein
MGRGWTMRLLLAFLITVTVVGFCFFTYPKIKSFYHTTSHEASHEVSYKASAKKIGVPYSSTGSGFWHKFESVLKAISEFVVSITPIVTAIASIIVWRRGRRPASGHPS